jgi:hypothetical protein
MKDRLNATEISTGQEKVRWFWLALLGDPFEAYQTAATL